MPEDKPLYSLWCLIGNESTDPLSLLNGITTLLAPLVFRPLHPTLAIEPLFLFEFASGKTGKVLEIDSSITRGQPSYMVVVIPEFELMAY
jgi:hypothetical protein